MDGFAVVPKSLLCEPFGVAGFLGAFRPGIPVRMQRDAFDSQSNTTLVEFGRTVTGPDTSQIRKQRSTVGKRAEQFGGLLVKSHQRNRAGLFPGKADNVAFPINVLRLQERDV